MALRCVCSLHGVHTSFFPKPWSWGIAKSFFFPIFITLARDPQSTRAGNGRQHHLRLFTNPSSFLPWEFSSSTYRKRGKKKPFCATLSVFIQRSPATTFYASQKHEKHFFSSSYNVNLKVTVLSRINSSQSNNHYLPEFDIFITHHISKFPLKMLKWFVIRHITALAVKMTNTSACTQTLNYTVINKDS